MKRGFIHGEMKIDIFGLIFMRKSAIVFVKLLALENGRPTRGDAQFSRAKHILKIQN
jgi:hypothetical protein